MCMMLQIVTINIAYGFLRKSLHYCDFITCPYGDISDVLVAKLENKLLVGPVCVKVIAKQNVPKHFKQATRSVIAALQK